MSRAPHKPTSESRAQVQALCGYGITEDEIATYIGIAPKTLRKHYRHELDTAVVKANALVARSLHKQAIDGNVSAAIFWLKVRAGWSEKSSLEISGPGGGPMEVADASAKLLDVLNRRAAAKA